jgi:acetyl-CoA decarbonylase/synthase complex subunit gamma
LQNLNHKKSFGRVMKHNFIIGYIETDAGNIPQVSSRLSWKDKLGTIKVRWSIGRNNYKIEPGLYAIGTPDKNSHVLVTANYKLSFDTLRKNLSGLNVWILVLDTKGINVWCAAGKGTFGTNELINRIKQTSLEKIVNHKRVILPQLGAVGVAAHSVKCASGFVVIYGPVRAADVPEYLKLHFKAPKEMRRVNFNFIDRVVLIPVDFIYRLGYLLAGLALVFIVAGINENGISFAKSIENGLPIMRNIFLAYVSGIVITPMILPYIPVRSFALKGFVTGFAVYLILFFTNGLGNNLAEIFGWFFFITGLSSFVAMNFTGSSTYTSLSGVKKEMKIAVPLQIASGIITLILFITGILI